MAATSQAQQANDLYEDDFTTVTVARKNRRDANDTQRMLTYLTLGVAVIAIIVGAVAISKADESNKKSEQHHQQNNANVAATKEAAELATGASTMLSTVPFCSESPQNRQACINLIAAGEEMIKDVANSSVTTLDIVHKANNPNTAYTVDSKISGLAATTDTAGSNTLAAGVVTDEEGHVINGDGQLAKDANGNPIKSELFDVDKCLFTYKNKLCFALVPVGETANSDRKRRSGGGSKYDLQKGQYVPVLHVVTEGFVQGKDGRMRRGGKRSAAIMGCLNGMATGGGAGAAMGGAIGTIVPGFGTAIGGAAGTLVGGALGCAAGGGWLGRR